MTARPAALVTGARRGIGRAICTALATKGFDIVAADIAMDGVTETEAAVHAAGGRFAFVDCDVADIAGHAAVVETAWAWFGGLECLVSNAGVGALKRGDLLEMTPESWDRCFGINTRGTFFLAQAVALLASGALPFSTGDSFHIDGGLHVHRL